MLTREFFFKNYVWSTVHDNASFYMAVNVAAVGNDFVALRSHEEETIACVIGEVRMLVDDYVCGPDNESDVAESDVCSQLLTEDERDEVCDKLLQECTVVMKQVPLYDAFPNLCWRTSVPVERLAMSTLFPGKIFRSECSENTPKSSVFPGCIFVGVSTPNWTQCKVPTECASVSKKLPGKIFSSHSKPVDRPSVSSKLPGRIFTSHSKPQMNWSQCTVPRENVPLSVRKPGHKFGSEAMYKQSITKKVPQRFQPALSLTHLVRGKHGSNEPLLMFHCRVCKARVDSSRSELKHHVEVSHSLFTCKNAHCVAAFKTESARDIHASVHMKKTHQCGQCSATFVHHFALKRHMTVHATHREHKCMICRRAYFRPQDLKEHYDTVHDKETFQCSACDYHGKSKRALKQHELVHKPPSLRCDCCEATFRWRS